MPAVLAPVIEPYGVRVPRDSLARTWTEELEIRLSDFSEPSTEDGRAPFASVGTGRERTGRNGRPLIHE